MLVRGDRPRESSRPIAVLLRRRSLTGSAGRDLRAGRSIGKSGCPAGNGLVHSGFSAHHQGFLGPLLRQVPLDSAAGGRRPVDCRTSEAVRWAGERVPSYGR